MSNTTVLYTLQRQCDKCGNWDTAVTDSRFEYIEYILGIIKEKNDEKLAPHKWRILHVITEVLEA